MKKSTLAVERCKTVSTIQKILGGKWKIEIIYYIAFQNIHRFGELRRSWKQTDSLPAMITKKCLPMWNTILLSWGRALFLSLNI